MRNGVDKFSLLSYKSYQYRNGECPVENQGLHEGIGKERKGVILEIEKELAINGGRRW